MFFRKGGAQLVREKRKHGGVCAKHYSDVGDGNIAYVEEGNCTLVSRRGNAYKSFGPLRTAIAEELRVRDAIIDGEIVCLDALGRSMFKELLFRRGNPVFYAFDFGSTATICANVRCSNESESCAY